MSKKKPKPAGNLKLIVTRKLMTACTVIQTKGNKKQNQKTQILKFQKITKQY